MNIAGEIARNSQRDKERPAIARAKRKAEKAERERLEKIAKTDAGEERARVKRENREAKYLAARLRNEKRVTEKAAMEAKRRSKDVQTYTELVRPKSLAVLSCLLMY